MLSHHEIFLCYQLVLSSIPLPETLVDPDLFRFSFLDHRTGQIGIIQEFCQEFLLEFGP